MASSLVSERPEAIDYLRFEDFTIQPLPMPAWKRLIDVVGALSGLFVLSPVLAGLAILIMAESPGGAFFRQRRVGAGGKCFTCWKFRSMHQGAENLLPMLMARNEASGPVFKLRDDPRRTRMGRFVRRTSLDELPQLLNVLRGDMSLVGPRPPTVGEVLQYDDHHLGRLAATPGMTGLWQVTLRGSAHDFSDMVALDIEYAEHRSFWLDVRILLKTVPTVVFGKGSV